MTVFVFVHVHLAAFAFVHVAVFAFAFVHVAAFAFAFVHVAVFAFEFVHAPRPAPRAPVFHVERPSARQGSSLVIPTTFHVERFSPPF